MQTRIIFIGGGNMAEAIFARLDPQKFALIVVQRNLTKLDHLQHKYSTIKFIPELNFTTTSNDLVVLAVKPQDAKTTCLDLKHLIKVSTIISVMAGITTSALNSWFDNTKIVRCMPNTPAQLGLAVSGIYFPPSIEQNQCQLIHNIFSNIGHVYTFDNEDFIDKITVIASSSPAYVYYFTEALIDSAIKQFGFTDDQARAITIQVLRGSLAMIENCQDTSLTQLRANVTSKKGTTDAAITTLETNNFKQIIEQAELSGYNRAKELGTLFN